MIEQNVTKSLEATVLARSSSQPKSTYEAAASLSEYELTKILLDKMEESKSHLRADYKRKLYDALVESYNTKKDLFNTYGEVFTLKSSRDDKGKDQDPSPLDQTEGRKEGSLARKLSYQKIKGKKKESHQVPLKTWKRVNNDEQPDDEDAPKNDWFKKPERPPTPDPTGTNVLRLQLNDSTGITLKASRIPFRILRKPSRSLIPDRQGQELSHTVDDSGVQKNQEFDTGNNDEQPDYEAASKSDCFTTRAEKPNTSFDEIMDTPIDFSAFAMNRLNIPNLTQELLATTERLDWHNPEGKPYPFDLRKPLPLIPDHQGRQVIPKDYFINNNLEYLKGGSLSRKYSTSVTKTKAATYEIKWIKDMVSNLWSPVKVVYDKHAYWVIKLKIMKWYDYGHLDKIEVHREDQQLYTFKEDPQGVIYKDQNNKNILMRIDELHKFSDGTLNIVRTALQDALGIRMEYLPKKKWSGLDKQRAHVMIQDIDKQLFQRRLMRNLEKFVGGREYENDLRLLERTI
ncbi:hypothetical protein Tco_0205779 [Tanacetum coccineum]